MAAGRQLRLLLWKDYLIRKRKVITLAGIIWATMVMMTLYVVRINIDNQDFPTCQFPARALPSAGMLTFVQSFVCSVNNDCEPLDRFQEIPTYENAKLTQLQRQLSPLLRNETVLSAAGVAPGALRLLGALADVLDNPDLTQITENGLTVASLFSSPARARRHIAAALNVTEAAADTVMRANLTLTGLFNEGFDRCKVESVANLLQVDNQEHLAEFVEKLCGLTENDIQKIAMGLIVEIDFSKYIKMAGEMYGKVSGDYRLAPLGGAARAAVRLTRMDSFLPRALTVLFTGRQTDFSYFQPAWITKLMDQIEPTFGQTKAFSALREFADMVVTGLTYLDKLMTPTDGVGDAAGLVAQVGRRVDDGADEGLKKITELFNNAVDMIENAAGDQSIDIFKILAQVLNVINKFLPEERKHDVLFYSTLLAKLIEGATRVVAINLDIQQMAYDVSLRHPKGVQVLLSLPLHVVRKGFEGLADAERVQIVTSKLNVRGQMFCDAGKMAAFFQVSRSDADSLKTQLCTDAWKDYVADLVQEFGIYDVKDIINNMASLVVQETFGKDTSGQLYTVEQVFAVLQNFTGTLLAMRSRPSHQADWGKLFNQTDDSAFMNIFKGRGNLGKQILVTVHCALAKEVVKQNAILDYKISPVLIDFTTMVGGVMRQLETTPSAVTDAVRSRYPELLQAMLETLMDEKKTYRALSTPSLEVVCRGVDAAARYIVLPGNASDQGLVDALCSATRAIEDGLRGDSEVAKAIAAVKKSSHGLAEVNWTALINGLKHVYLKLDADYPYLFEFTSYGMSEDQQRKVQALMDEAKGYWFNTRRLDRTLHFCIKLVFRLLDVVDRDVFGLRSEGWLRMKHAFHSVSQPLGVVHDLVSLLIAVGRGESPASPLPGRTAASLRALVPALPPLLRDIAHLATLDDLDLQPITSLMNAEPAWPCSNDSLSSVLPLSPGSVPGVHAVEELMCLDSGVRQEWLQYIQDRHISLYNSSTWNSTVFGPHVFLNLSATFDGLVEDTVLIKELFASLVNESRVEGTGGELTVVGAWKYAAAMFDGVDRNDTLRKLFRNIDTVLNSVSTDPGSVPINALWGTYAFCTHDCSHKWRAATKATLQAAAIVLRDATEDLLKYFKEINEPGAGALPLLGFTRGTGLRLLADRLPEFVAALLNSYWDFGFMSQVRRAALSEFWDCEAVVSALAPAPGLLEPADLARVKPWLCPSLLYWISLPRGDNTFLDIVAKPQYTFYTLPAENLTSSFEDAYNKTTELVSLLATLRNKTEVTTEDATLPSLQNKLRETVDTVLNYRLNESDPSYRLFNEVNKKQFLAMIYLTRVTAIVNNIATAIEKLKPEDINKDFTEEEANKVKSELVSLSKVFKRRPNEVLAVHFDVITNILSTNDDNFSLVKGLEVMCDDFAKDDDSKDILNEGPRTKNQICSKDYKAIFGAVQGVVDDDYDATRRSLHNLLNALKDGEDEVQDVAKFFKDRKKLTASLKSSLKYSYELGLPVYTQYLHSSVQSFGVVAQFLAGGDWWTALRRLYTGPHATGFLDAVEMSLDVAEDVLTKLDEIHLVRLLRDINVNDTSAFCGSGVSLGEYVPDASGALTRLQRQACTADPERVFREIPPLVLASQGYDDELQLSKDVNYTSLYADISATEALLETIRDGPRAPTRPTWVQDDKLQRVRDAAMELLSKETLTKITFGVLSNVVDAGTLFLNNSQCVFCSSLTSWVKQLNLQLYKRQEYDALLCGVRQMRPAHIHDALTGDFHWDMAYRELISSRNYTKYELNKSLNELLGQVKLQLLEDLQRRGRLAECLLPPPAAAGDAFTHAALVMEAISRILLLVEAELPHLHEVEGMAQASFFRNMRARVAPALDAYRPLPAYLVNDDKVREDLKAFVSEEVVDKLLGADINLRAVGRINEDKAVDTYLIPKPGGTPWLGWICSKYDCKKIATIVENNVNKTLVAKDLEREQDRIFWTMAHITGPVQRAMQLTQWAARLLQLGSRLQLGDVLQGKLAPMVDFVLAVTSMEALDTLDVSVQGLLSALEPLLGGSELDGDLRALVNGLLSLGQYKDDLAKEDLTVPLGSLFKSPESLQRELELRGVSNTDFWSQAVPRLREGQLMLKPVLTWQLESRVQQLTCTPAALAQLLATPAPAAPALQAISEQFCSMPDDQARQLVPVLMAHLNFSYVLDKVSDFLLAKLYTAANLSSEEGALVTAGLPRLAAVLPAIQASVGDAMADLGQNPLLKTLANATTIGGLLGYVATHLSLIRSTTEEGALVTAGLPRLAAVLPAIQASVGDAVADLGQNPLLKTLANATTIGGLLGSPQFLAQAGDMVCGSPFVADVPRLFRSVLASEDMTAQPDQAQIDSLPTEFCQSLYQDIISAEGGKIVWSFVKPLLRGQVLYTPSDPLVERIIQRANASFAHMDRLASLVHSFAGSFPAVSQLSSHRAGVAVLARLLTSPAFKDLRSSLLGDVDVPDVDFESMLDEFGDLSGVGRLVSKVSNLLRCINLDRFHATAGEDELAHQAAKLTLVNEFSAGLVFLNSEQQGGAPTNLSYKIRMDIDNVPTTSRMKNFLWIPGPEANFLENMRYFRGFVQLQDLVDQAIIEEAAHATARHRREAVQNDQGDQGPDWAVWTQQMPYPCYRKDFFQTSLYESQALIVALFFSLLFSVAAAVRFIVADYESGNTMLMHVMGVNTSLNTLSWFLWALLEGVATSACIALVLSAGGVLPRSAFSLVFALVVVFSFSVLCFCYMLSKLFRKASFGAVCAGVAYLASFMPFVLILSLEAVITRAAKLLICLSMSSAVCYAFLHVTRLEATGAGADWSHLWEATDADDVSMGVAVIMMLVDAAVYVAIGLVIDHFFGLKRLQSNITQCRGSAEKAGVSVVGVCASYGSHVALDHVSLELRRGQLTTLLGHNGAGKTTLINILTGMARPTRGHVVVRGGDGDDARHAGARLGVCPQRDVLHAHLSPREHVALYAQLKAGRPLAELRDEVEGILRVLSLGPVADRPAWALSGGTRRRLCVALAFVCEPHLVTLDEPTSGVDPAARRDIWSMIVKLKKERTILMTTHHLDEAELLSDQIVIMHKGQVHTTGSPVEIKRALGNGYRLTVTYPADTHDGNTNDGASDDGKDTVDGGDSNDGSVPTVEERSKTLLGAVRDIVPNASLLDVNELNVELTLPFFDANGLNNNFLQLCTTMESKQTTLGFRSYALDCSSLEQVFHAVCQQADRADHDHIRYDPSEDVPSKSASTSSVRTDAPLVSASGPKTGTALEQLYALLLARALHYMRNRWLLFVVLVLPSLFVGIAMGFSTIRPPPDNEVALLLSPDLYPGTTEFVVPEPSLYSEDADPSFARQVMRELMLDETYKNWTAEDTPSCQCSDAMQTCSASEAPTARRMALPDTGTLLDWLVSTHQQYIGKRYGGYSSSVNGTTSRVVAWYNNKGHHALPARLSALRAAALRARVGGDARIRTYSHPMKISPEQISKDTVYQHVADAGISGLLVVAYSLVSAGAAVHAVSARRDQQKRLALLSGVSPALYWTHALIADMIVILINMVITVILMEAFHFPVFVERNNLPAICILILLYGFSCGAFVHAAEKAFSDASVANMLLFCGNAFLGLGGITVLLILDVISDSEKTDNARWYLHKIFMISPQFALGDGLLEIAKNTIQAQVLSRFGMDTYRDPLRSWLVGWHFLSMAAVGALLFLLNLAIEYQAFDWLLIKFQPRSPLTESDDEDLLPEDADVSAERVRVAATLAQADDCPLRLRTIGNINAGFVDTEGCAGAHAGARAGAADVAACVGLGKAYGRRVALRNLTLGLPPGECTVLLGENGAGKSTTFALLTAQARPAAGALYLRARLASHTDLARGDVSYCPQSDAIDPLLTVRETLDMYCRLRGIAERDEVIPRTLQMFELARYSDAFAGELSGGNKRKLCTAIAFMSRSELVLLDEPTSGMDPMARACVRRGALAACAGARAVLVSTHALGDARALASRVALLRQGRLRALAPLDDCLARFGGGYVVECVTGAGAAGEAWRRVAALAPQARLRVLHAAALHFLLPTRAIVNDKEVTTRLSDIFRLMAELQGSCDIEDYTVNQSSLEQMFLSFSERGPEEATPDSNPDPPSADDLASVTAL